MAEWPLPPVVRDHLVELTGSLGIHQHARGRLPDPSYGTCTDDVARALLVDLQHARVVGWEAVAATARRSLVYLREAFDPGALEFRNFRDDTGGWLPGPVSQDCQGRAMLALAAAATQVPESELADQAAALLEAACGAARELTASRAIASALLACTIAAGDRFATVPETAGGGRVRPIGRTLELLARRLGARFARSAGDPGWPWPEQAVTYESVLLPRALLAAGARLGGRDLTWLGRRSLHWLLDELVDADGQFHPVGNQGWWRRGDVPARYDQQPIEAGAMVAAADTAHALTGDPRYLAAAEAAFAWFLGDNDAGLPVAVPERGSCRDGLGVDGLNLNEGAESTLAWLAAVEHLRELRRRAESARIVADSGRPSLLRAGRREARRHEGEAPALATAQRNGSGSPRGSGSGQLMTYSRTAR